jgi:cell division septation protein DedD
MRPRPAGLAAVVALAAAGAAHAQQGSLQVTAAAQTLTGESRRLAGQYPFEPDFGVLWLQPGSTFSNFELELRATTRAGELRRGRSHVAARDGKFGGLSWTFEGGDTYFIPPYGNYRFSNLFTPAVTFAGGSASARSSRTFLSIVGGRATIMRNIFGTDPDPLGQTIGAAALTRQVSERVELTVHASRIRNTGLTEIDFTTAASDQAGGGGRLRISRTIDVTGDASLVSYRRIGMRDRQRDVSAMLGANWLLSRGWVQLNASRFSAGELPVFNNSLQDREGLFATGEYDLWSRSRGFAGVDVFRNNLHSSGSGGDPRPEGMNSRVFGGLRLRVTPRSTVTLRAESGARVLRPVRTPFSVGIDRESDTGSLGVEWQATYRHVTGYARYTRRENIDRQSVDATFSQHDAFGQLFLNLSATTQVFGLANVARNTTGTGAETVYWQAGGGTQLQTFRQNLWLRLEGTASRNTDFLTGTFVPGQSIGLGLNGQLTRQTTLGLNVYADRAPSASFSGSPWLTRSTVRLTQTLQTGRPPLTTSGAPGARRSRATASVTGSVFADWNGNGVQDPGEGPIADIPLLVGDAGLRTSREGRFAFVNVPAGLQYVGLDVSAVPVDFNPPRIARLQIDLADGETRRLDFGLVPLGSVHGRIVRDINNNGTADGEDLPVDGAVVVLDGGVRSERAEKGRFAFEAVPSGTHVVQLLTESLPEGATVRNDASVPVALSRDGLGADVTFLVSVEQRQEIRRVFPATTDRRASPQPPPLDPRTARRPARAPAASTPPESSSVPRTPRGSDVMGRYVIQVAALRSASKAQSLAAALAAGGFPAYLDETMPDGLTRVRVGPYDTRAAAQEAARVLEKRGGERPWVIGGRKGG